MFERMVVGSVPAKHHIAHREDGQLRHEECITRDGFEGPYTIAYHVRRPHTARILEPAPQGWPIPTAAPEDASRPLAKRHYVTPNLVRPSGTPLTARIPLLFNADVICGVASPTTADTTYVSNGDGDELIYAHRGGGLLRSMLGDLEFVQGDYVFIPKGLLHRLLPSNAPQEWLWFELSAGLHIPTQWRNKVGQLRMDAPYCHRDFKQPVFVGPLEENIRELAVKRNGRWHGFVYEESPLDVVGWDGTVYPWAFPILNFQARAGLVHLPPTWHGTFATRGALICSFVPRVVDFHPDAIPCPYPHSAPDCDEIIFYADGNFTSRVGVSSGSISHHPMGVIHGPHPGAYERSIGATRTDELAVMVDTERPLQPTAAALGIEDPEYHNSFI